MQSVCGYSCQYSLTGYMAGPQMYYSGGGANYLCLPENPQYGTTTARAGYSDLRIYGVLYTQAVPNISLANGNQPMLNEDAVCAVCVASDGRSTSIMIPARLQCPADWTTEYNGYLVAQCPYCNMGQQSPSDMVCLDEEPEVRANGAAYDSNGQRWQGGSLTSVSAMCGILPCSWYVDLEFLTCVVCTQ